MSRHFESHFSSKSEGRTLWINLNSYPRIINNKVFLMRLDRQNEHWEDFPCLQKVLISILFCAAFLSWNPQIFTFTYHQSQACVLPRISGPPRWRFIQLYFLHLRRRLFTPLSFLLSNSIYSRENVMRSILYGDELLSRATSEQTEEDSSSR